MASANTPSNLHNVLSLVTFFARSKEGDSLAAGE
jgi:hypothetical protein